LHRYLAELTATLAALNSATTIKPALTRRWPALSEKGLSIGDLMKLSRKKIQ
jgi:hypothetical protein